MNASSFITFVTNMLQQNGIRFYKRFYVILKTGIKPKETYSICIEL